MNNSWVIELARRARVSDHAFARWIYREVRVVYRFLGRWVWFLGLGWVNSVRRLHHTGDGWAVEGWAYHRGTDFGDQPQFTAWLTRWGRKIKLDVTTMYEIEARAAAKAAEFDYARNGFAITVPDTVLDRLSEGKQYTLRVQIKGNGHRVRGRVTSVSRLGSVALAGVQYRPDGRLAGPVLSEDRGLRFARISPVAIAQSVVISDREQTVTLTTGGVKQARLVGLFQAAVPLEVSEVDGRSVISVKLPEWEALERDPAGRRESWRIELPDGRRWRPVAADDATEFGGEAESVYARRSVEAEVEFVHLPVAVIVESVEVSGDDPQRVSISGTFSGPPEFRLEFRSRFEVIPVELSLDGNRFTGTSTLELSRWNGPTKPPPLGTYGLTVITDNGVNSTFLAGSVGKDLPQTFPSDVHRLRVVCARRDQLALRFGPPRTDEEFGAWRQLQLRQEFTAGSAEPIDAVYFESFFGRNATCNPMAIDAEFARLHPEIPRYWGVQNNSIVVPDGSIPLVRGTREWWRIRSSARWIVTNEWLRENYVKQPFQTVMQTWHGSMYKQIGLDRGGKGKSQLKIVERERVKWDLFVSQAPETTPIIKRAYALDEQVVETGYPRNDELGQIDDTQRLAIRERLGLPADTTIVMYAPTWREQVQGEVSLLNLEQLGRVLGEDFTLLMRGHVRTLANATAESAANVLDVSTYPQINDLLGVADVLITDYSSMMFDFSVTGRPMIFYTPDIASYTDAKVRGSYFDLQERAPGPVVLDVVDVLKLLRNLDTWPAEYAEKYQAWRERYNVLDDGHAAERAMEALLAFQPVAREKPRDLEADSIIDPDTEGPGPESG